MLNKKKTAPTWLTEGEVKELVEDTVRTAIREQARDLEKHFGDIHSRLLTLENKRR